MIFSLEMADIRTNATEVTPKIGEGDDEPDPDLSNKRAACEHLLLHARDCQIVTQPPC